tara:strand:- start:165 stop:563 length:399 start_codon:yes stop_codon:yes gene_type:complete
MRSSHAECFAEQEAPTNVAIALKARVGRNAVRVASYKELNYCLVENLARVEDIKRDIQQPCHLPCLPDCIWSTAAIVPVPVLAGLAPQAQHEPENIVALLTQQRGRDRAIHPAAHRHCHTLSVNHLLPSFSR